MSYQTKNIYYLGFCRKSLLNPGLRNKQHIYLTHWWLLIFGTVFVQSRYFIYLKEWIKIKYDESGQGKIKITIQHLPCVRSILGALHVCSCNCHSNPWSRDWIPNFQLRHWSSGLINDFFKCYKASKNGLPGVWAQISPIVRWST